MTVTISFHGKKRKLMFLAAVVLAAVVVFFVCTAHASGGIPGAENEDRIRFLHQCGWQVEEEPLSVREVTIPKTFSKVYQQYNALNQQAGFDLTKSAGKVCQQYVYHVTNYAGNPDVRATLLVCQKRIIGGDLSTAALDGFMKPLRKTGS